MKDNRNLTAKQRKNIAIKAVSVRERRKLLPKATHTSSATPLKLGNIHIPCSVLNNGKRVFVQGNMSLALGMSDSGGQRINYLIDRKWLNEFTDQTTLDNLNNPIEFITKEGKIAKGYEATLLVDICSNILDFRNKNLRNNKILKFTDFQEQLFEKSEIIIRNVAKVGIIALVDEATGYQEEREKTELSEILQKFITKELQPWAYTFPLDFYKELYRIRNLEYGKEKIPSYFGHLTNNIIYKRLAPEILDHLKRLTPKSQNGHKTARYFQSLSKDLGYHRLKEHLGSVVTLMKLSNNYDEFENKLNKIHPLFEDEKVN